MKIKEYKNKIVLAELNPDADYILLFNPTLMNPEIFRNLQVRGDIKILFVPVYDVDKAVKFVEIPKRSSQ